jgi:hypothetical protein
LERECDAEEHKARQVLLVLLQTDFGAQRDNIGKDAKEPKEEQG